LDCENICFQGKINDTHGTLLLLVTIIYLFLIGGCCFQNGTDCAGYCNGTHAYDKTVPSAICCYPNETDCGGYCNGTRMYDPSNVCCFANQTDCGHYCFGNRSNDSLDNCCFANQTDCANICNGICVIIN
jgi:hypothetical protein